MPSPPTSKPTTLGGLTDRPGRDLPAQGRLSSAIVTLT
jgi:hypothetical protein